MGKLVGRGKDDCRRPLDAREKSFTEEEPEWWGFGLGYWGNNVVRFRNRQDRERYMDSLERQMEHQRQEIQRTLDEIQNPSRRRTALEKLRRSVPGIPGRAFVREAGEREAATEKPERAETQSGTGGSWEGVERPWWRRVSFEIHRSLLLSPYLPIQIM